MLSGDYLALNNLRNHAKEVTLCDHQAACRAAIQRWESVAGMEQHKLKEAHVTG